MKGSEDREARKIIDKMTDSDLEKMRILPSQIPLISGLNALARVFASEKDMLKILFPISKLGKSYLVPTKSNYLISKFFDDQLNPEQIKCIIRILSHRSPHPFILFGPPGINLCTIILKAFIFLSFKIFRG